MDRRIDAEQVEQVYVFLIIIYIDEREVLEIFGYFIMDFI